MYYFKQFLNRIKERFFQKQEINYIYFSILFISLSTFSLSHFLFWEAPLFGIRLFFLLYSLVQAFFEIWILLFVAYFLKKAMPRWCFFTFISFSFFILILHFTDFTLIRLMDTSISYVFKLLFGRGIDHIVTAFRAMNMNFLILFIMGITILALPLAGVCLYLLTSRISRKKPSLSPNQMMIFLSSLGMFLIFVDLIAQPYVDRILYNKHQKALPFGAMLFSPAPDCLTIKTPFTPPRKEVEMKAFIPKMKAKHKPNIYLFIIESLRRDFIDFQTAPHLTSFAQENIDVKQPYANANWTPCSWFGIFHSSYPHYWSTIRDEWKSGSIPLQLLKQMGYKTIVYSSADLHYFNMDQVIFGEKRELIHKIHEYYLDHSLPAWKRDSLCIQDFEKTIASPENQEGCIHIFFFDATHSEYSFPQDLPLKFQPIVDQIDYLTVSKKEIEEVKNRYRNAISYIDTLIHRFFETLKTHHKYEDAVIAITGDHAEEFFEEGALFHGTHLNEYQMKVPIFLKFPNKNKPIEKATHIDLFPSILHYISGKSDFSPLFDGESIFKKNRSPYQIAISQNGIHTPFEFLISNGASELHLRFLNPQDTFSGTKLEITQLKVPASYTAQDSNTIIQALFPTALDSLLERK